jgi:hypothetical protein
MEIITEFRKILSNYVTRNSTEFRRILGNFAHTKVTEVQIIRNLRVDGIPWTPYFTVLLSSRREVISVGVQLGLICEPIFSPLYSLQKRPASGAVFAS